MSQDAGRMEEIVDELLSLEESVDVESFVATQPELANRSAVERLTKELVREARSDLRRAERLSQVVTRLAEASGDDYSLALSFKARGHMSYLAGRYDEAHDLYRACQERFFAAGAEVEAAMNLCSGSQWALALLGRYRQAAAERERAREILERHGDPLLLARLSSNEANVLVRQDQHAEAIERYQQALEVFRRRGEDQDVVVALNNIAVSSIAILDFDGVLEVYRELSEHCARTGMELVAVRADYNIAYLYFTRGEYGRALECYQVARKEFERLDDPYHGALCDLDQAEIYLELNLHSEGARLARQALDAFEQLGNGYEAAKATAFLAIAAEHGKEPERALELFAEAQSRFENEGNQAWGAIVDFYRALLLLRVKQLAEARTLADRALAYFVDVSWPARAALCHLLLARMDLAEGRATAARRRSAEARRCIEGLGLPAVGLKTFVVEAHALELLGEHGDALTSLRRASDLAEDLRSHLRTEELKIAFLEDKEQLYGSLVSLILGDDPSPETLYEAFSYIERAKSRTLADLMASRVTLLPTSGRDHDALVERIRAQRHQLNAQYSELDRLRGLRSGVDEALTGPPGEAARPRSSGHAQSIRELQDRCRTGEDELLASLTELRSLDPELAALHSATTVDLERIQASLPRDSQLLEYFEARGRFYVCLVDRQSLAIEPLGSGRKVREHLRNFSFQIGKHRIPKEVLETLGGRLEHSTRICLERLYAELIGPIIDRLSARHLIIAPHGPLHRVPFHALHDGERYLIDRFSFSFVPSASIYAMTSLKEASGRDPALVLGVADDQAPEIRAEVDAIGRVLPDARILVGGEATLERLRESAAGCRLLHIATHGFFRQDNPMFSGIQLADARLTLFDLYELRVGAELVVLSGCSTGLHTVASGDELLGLTRGFMYAGALSVLVTLWDVNDESSAEFMQSFYGHLGSRSSIAPAVAAAIRELRKRYTSPFYWAPFALVGRPFGGSA